MPVTRLSYQGKRTETAAHCTLPDTSLPAPGSLPLLSSCSHQDSYARYLKSPIYKEMLAKAIEPQETTKRRQVERL